MRYLSSLRRISERYPGWVDAAIALVLGALILLGIRVAWPGPATVPGWQAVLLTIWLIAPLAFRRRAPLATLVVMTPALIVFGEAMLPEYNWAVNAWWLALFSAGAYGAPPWRNWVRALASIVWLSYLAWFIVFDIDYDQAPFDERLLQILALASNVLFLAVVWWFGDTVRIGRAREAELAAKTVELEREREENAAQAVLAERLRIARELHDVVANHVSVVGVQAGAARRILARDPEQAVAALTAIEATSRLAVQELQQLLGLLREGTGELPRSAQPGLAQLDELAAHMRAAGVLVELRIVGTPRSVTPAVELSIYRIVQEGLTNTLKHANGAPATVTLTYLPDSIDLTIEDTGKTPPVQPSHHGNGLIGMQERVTLLGGTLHTGYRAGTGFAVHAHLPVPAGNGASL
jgi:signal transduction histidine kinase